MCALTHCSFVITNQRRSGSWNRELLAGVSVIEIIASHMIVNTVVMLLKLPCCALTIYLSMSLTNNGSLFLEIFGSILMYIIGLLNGLLMSCTIEDYTMSSFAIIGTIFISCIVSGGLWWVTIWSQLLIPIKLLFLKAIGRHVLSSKTNCMEHSSDNSKSSFKGYHDKRTRFV